MADWTSPRTWVDEEKVTHTIMNTHVRDNLKHLEERLVADGIVGYCHVGHCKAA